MAAQIRKAMVISLLGTSLTNGRFAAPPKGWDLELKRHMMSHPNCKGEVLFQNLGKGSQTSDWGVTQAPLIRDLRPTHVLMEDFAINDCAIGPVSLAQATANFQLMVDIIRTNNAGVNITHQTMSPASASDANRTNLAAYYDNGKANALANGIPTLDHYANWPKPLDPLLTIYDGSGSVSNPSNYDGLHPVWANAVELYTFPLLKTWGEQKMAEFWA